ncbi:MAG: hypothetical protein ACK56I_33230, partial [bacterium]
HVRLCGVHHQTEVRLAVWMYQGRSLAQRHLGRSKRRLHGGGPLHGGGSLPSALEGVCQQRQGAGDPRKETAIKVHHSQESLQLPDGQRRRKIPDGGDVAL